MSDETQTAETMTTGTIEKRRGRPRKNADPNAPATEAGMSIKLSADVANAIKTTASKFNLSVPVVKQIFVNSVLANVDASSVRKAVGAHFAAAAADAQDHF